MELDQLDLNPRVLAALKRAGLKSVKEVLRVSGPDLQRCTGLSSPDIQRLLTAAAMYLRGHCVLTVLQLYQQREHFPTQHQRLSLGCPWLDRFLGGGLPLDGITELAGRSSAGKTQLALQLCLAVQFPQQHGGLEAGAIYICTEDTFPSKRLRQLIAQQPRLRTDVPAEVIRNIRFGDQIFVEHAADVVPAITGGHTAPAECCLPEPCALCQPGDRGRGAARAPGRAPVPSPWHHLGQPAPHEADGRPCPRGRDHTGPVQPPSTDAAGGLRAPSAPRLLLLHSQRGRGAGNPRDHGL